MLCPHRAHHPSPTCSASTFSPEYILIIHPFPFASWPPPGCSQDCNAFKPPYPSLPFIISTQQPPFSHTTSLPGLTPLYVFPSSSLFGSGAWVWMSHVSARCKSASSNGPPIGRRPLTSRIMAAATLCEPLKVVILPSSPLSDRSGPLDQYYGQKLEYGPDGTSRVEIVVMTDMKGGGFVRLEISSRAA